MPQDLLTVREAIDGVLGRYTTDGVETSWIDAGPIPGDPDWVGGTAFADRRTAEIDAPPSSFFRAVQWIGGGNGWYAADVLWRLRGLLDRLAGGPGLRRGRRDPEKLGQDDALDFWRVTGIEPDRRLQMRAVMRLPGDALLEYEISEKAEGSMLAQTSRFKPRGLAGLLYWYAVLPFHGFVFRGMLGGIRRTAETLPSA